MDRVCRVPDAVKRLTAADAEALVRDKSMPSRRVIVHIAWVLIERGACDVLARAIEHGGGAPAVLSLHQCIVSEAGVLALVGALIDAWEAGRRLELWCDNVATSRRARRLLRTVARRTAAASDAALPVELRVFECRHVARRRSFREDERDTCFGATDECHRARALAEFVARQRGVVRVCE